MNIISYFIGGALSKIYIEFGISGVLAVEEEDNEKVVAEISRLISKFLKNKKVIKLDNKFESIDELEIVEGMVEPAEA